MHYTRGQTRKRHRRRRRLETGKNIIFASPIRMLECLTWTAASVSDTVSRAISNVRPFITGTGDDCFSRRDYAWGQNVRCRATTTVVCCIIFSRLSKRFRRNNKSVCRCPFSSPHPPITHEQTLIVLGNGLNYNTAEAWFKTIGLRFEDNSLLTTTTRWRRHNNEKTIIGCVGLAYTFDRTSVRYDSVRTHMTVRVMCGDNQLVGIAWYW